MIKPFLSVVVPIYNEEANIERLYDRLTKVLSSLDLTYEIILCNDGSEDKTAQLLSKLFRKDSAHIRVINLVRNYGQHMAIMAGFQYVKGNYAVTLDADMQTPPEELPKIIEKIKEGYDYVGTFRIKRKDSRFRTYVSWIVNRIRAYVTHVDMKDHGCMLRAYHKDIVKEILACHDKTTLVPVLAYTHAHSYTEIGMHHASRQEDQSKYTLYKLARMNFDLFTGFSLVPIQLFTFSGLIVAFLSSLLVAYLMIRRFFLGAEAEGLFTLFAILFFLISFVITGIGILGEYVGRTYELLQSRPPYLIRDVLLPKAHNRTRPKLSSLKG